MPSVRYAVTIAQTLPLSEVARAHRIIETSVPAGKIILDPTRG